MSSGIIYYEQGHYINDLVSLGGIRNTPGLGRARQTISLTYSSTGLVGLFPANAKRIAVLIQNERFSPGNCQVEITPGDGVVMLSPGDSFQIDANFPTIEAVYLNNIVAGNTVHGTEISIQ